jgi:small subunit ribosomal protein S5
MSMPENKTAGGPQRSMGQRRDGGRSGDRGGRRPPRVEEPKEFDQRILELARVTRVTQGGKRMRFRSCVILGDHKGRVGFGVAKGSDVQQSVQKSVTQAKKKMITVPLINETIPHAVSMKFAAASILIKPAPKGTGVKAGGAVRVVLELAGIPNVVAKILGSKNKINNTKAAMLALQQFKVSAKKEKKSEEKADKEAVK